MPGKYRGRHTTPTEKAAAIEVPRRARLPPNSAAAIIIKFEVVNFQMVKFEP
jgi:hypothetical protein